MQRPSFSRIFPIFSVVLVGVGFALPVESADPPSKAPEADTVGFRDNVKPFLAAHCNRCHGEKKTEGKLDLTKLSGDLAAGKSIEIWQKIVERMNAGEMPPEGEKQPTPESIKKVATWVEGELVKAGKTGAVIAGNLKTGNHIPHHLLFGPNAGKAPLDNPSRLWRISPAIYAESTKNFKNLKIAQPFALPPGDGFRDRSNVGGLDESTTAQLMRNAEVIAESQLGLSLQKIGQKQVAGELGPLLTASPTPKEIETAIAYQFDLVLRRKPTSEELKRFSDLYAKTAKLGGPEGGARSVLVAVFLQPEASFRSELGSGSSEGKKLLAPREMAFAISYALTDRAPDAELLKAADTGKLNTPADVEREVKRLFSDTTADKVRITRFFREYFGYATALDVFKESKQFPAHNARGLVEDTDKLIADILAEDKDVFLQLMTTTKSYVHYKNADQNQKQIADAMAKYEKAKENDPKAAAKGPPNLDGKKTFLVYGLKDFPETQPTTLPKEQRAGILTQPSWLVANSENFDNHAIRRGKWIRERLLGGTVPEIPISVDAQLPDAPHKTLRERMQVTKEVYCWQCHKKMNPIGLTFEQFDHFGRFRTQDEVSEEKVDPKGKKIVVPKNVALDSTGKIDLTGDAKIEGDFTNAVELIHKLAKTDRARQVFIRHAFRYWMGREENLGDAKTLMAADEAYIKSGGSMKALITSLLTSESFLYRTGK